MHWHVLGAGSIGGLWATRLAFAGFPVTLLLKDRAAKAAFDKTPLRLESADGIDHPAVDAVAVADYRRGIEWLLVTTKSYATLAALTQLAPRLSERTKILLLQNGIGFQQQVAESFPQCEIIAGISTDGAWRRAPFHVVFAGRGKTRFGAVDRVTDDSIGALGVCLAKVRLDAAWAEDIWPLIWHKAAINCCINALTAILRCRNGELLECDWATDTIRGIVTEIGQVMAAAGLEYSFPNLYDEVIDVIEATAENFSSMYQDLARGRETEINFLNGYICDQGQAFDVATPLNRTLCEAISAQTGR